MFRYIVTVVYLERAEGAVVEGLSHVDDLLTLNTHKTIKLKLYSRLGHWGGFKKYTQEQFQNIPLVKIS